MKPENYGMNGLSGVSEAQHGTMAPEFQHIRQALDHIKNVLEKEIGHKQALMEKQLSDIGELKADLAKSKTVQASLHQRLQDCLRNAEGNRQLINKLLHDISQHQNDIEWYKRTYEKRSVWGMLKDRLGKRK